MEFVGILISVLGSTLGSVYMWKKEKEKERINKEYEKKEERYISLVKSIKGFYNGTHDQQKIDQFLDEFYLSWLYCPDNVIKKGKEFLIKLENSNDEKEIENALADFILEMRKDLINRKKVDKTNLTTEDYKFYRAKN